MTVFQKGEMNPEEFLTYDQKIGRLFIFTPWPILVPFCIIIILITTYGLVLPSVVKRQWNPPPESQLIWQDGWILNDRVNNRSQYNFFFNGNSSIIHCNAYGTPLNCLGDIGMRGSTPNRVPAKIALFRIKTYAGRIYVIAAAKIGPNIILPYDVQHASLLQEARLEDQSKRLPIFKLGLAAVVFIHVLIGMYAKLRHRARNA